MDRYHAQGANSCSYAGQFPLSEKKLWIPTGPMLGGDIPLAKRATKARVREDQLLQLAGF